LSGLSQAHSPGVTGAFLASGASGFQAVVFNSRHLHRALAIPPRPDDYSRSTGSGICEQSSEFTPSGMGQCGPSREGRHFCPTPIGASFSDQRGLPSAQRGISARLISLASGRPQLSLTPSRPRFMPLHPSESAAFSSFSSCSSWG